MQLAKLCWRLREVSIECPYPWIITTMDRWYWYNPAPNTYLALRVDKTHTWVTRKVVAEYDNVQYPEENQQAIYWKGEESLTLHLYDYFKPMICLQRPKTLIVKGEWDDASTNPFIVRRPNHPLFDLVKGATNWSSFCRTILEKAYPNVVGPWGNVEFTAKWNGGEWTCTIDHCEWYVNVPDYQNHRLIWENAKAWLAPGISFSVTVHYIAREGEIVMGGVIGEGMNFASLTKASVSDIDNDVRQQLTSLTLYEVTQFPIDGGDLFPKVEEVLMRRCYQDMYAFEFPSFPNVKIVNTDCVYMFTQPLVLSCLSYESSNYRVDRLRTTLEVEELWLHQRQCGIRFEEGMILTTRLHIFKEVKYIPMEISYQIEHLYVHGQHPPCFFQTIERGCSWKKNLNHSRWPNLREVTFVDRTTPLTREERNVWSLLQTNIVFH